jgi:glycosyltransferase involved in cell wall biosynthesis
MAFVVNGKYTSQRLTGVQRLAYELSRAMQGRDIPVDELEVVVPPNAATLEPPIDRKRVAPRFTGNLWEQLTLPLATRGKTLVSFCNTAPLLKRDQVVMIHDMAVHDVPHAFSKKFVLWYRVMFAILARQGVSILTVSEFSKGRICHHLGVDESRVSVIYPGADHFERIVSDPSIVTRLKLKKDAYCVIVGSLDPRKNLERVLAAIEKLDHLPDVKFVVVGGSYPRVFASMKLETATKSERVIWAGFVSDNELKGLYADAACLVFPSLYEGFGMPPCEAMYCGCPVLVSNEASIPEVCGDAAMYCDAHSVDDIATKLGAMLSDPALRQHHRELGLRHVQRYRWERSATNVLEALYGEAHGRAAGLTVNSSAG